MTKLFRANMARLWKSKVFWLEFSALVTFCVLQKIILIQDSVETHPLEETFWIQAFVIGIVLSVFISLFVGSEYEYGTMRNKIISGHSRTHIYLANVFVCILAGWIMCLGCMVFSLLIGVPFLGFFQTELSKILLQGICVFALIGTYGAIYCFFCHADSQSCYYGYCLCFTLIFAVVCRYCPFQPAGRSGVLLYPGQFLRNRGN